MKDLHGLGLALTRLDHEQQTAADLARVRALQTGAFVSNWQHAKYDTTKQPVCQICFQLGTQRHWLCCPRFAEYRATCGDLQTWMSTAPSCVVHPLLALDHHMSCSSSSISWASLTPVLPTTASRGKGSETKFLLIVLFE